MSAHVDRALLVLARRPPVTDPAAPKPAAPVCVVCGGPSPGIECNSCFIGADVVFERSQDV